MCLLMHSESTEGMLRNPYRATTSLTNYGIRVDAISDDQNVPDLNSGAPLYTVEEYRYTSSHTWHLPEAGETT